MTAPDHGAYPAHIKSGKRHKSEKAGGFGAASSENTGKRLPSATGAVR
jgi:hypothetical protein